MLYVLSGMGRPAVDRVLRPVLARGTKNAHRIRLLGVLATLGQPLDFDQLLDLTIRARKFPPEVRAVVGFTLGPLGG